MCKHRTHCGGLIWNLVDPRIRDHSRVRSAHIRQSGENPRKSLRCSLLAQQRSTPSVVGGGSTRAATRAHNRAGPCQEKHFPALWTVPPRYWKTHRNLFRWLLAPPTVEVPMEEQRIKPNDQARLQGVGSPCCRVPHGGARPFHQKSSCTTQLTLGRYVVQIWSRATEKQQRSHRNLRRQVGWRRARI